MLRIRWPVFVALALALLVPAPALADEVNPLDGFASGLDTLVNPDADRVVETDPVRDYDYEPSLRADDGETAALPEEGSEIQSVIGAVNVNPLGGNSGSRPGLIGSLWGFLYGFRSLTLVIPVGLVFFWWGLRKAKNVIVSAWRSGRISV